MRGAGERSSSKKFKHITNQKNPKMRHNYVFYAMLAMMFLALKVSAQVSINTDGSTPDP